MRSAVVAVVLFALIVAGLVVVALEGYPSSRVQPTVASGPAATDLWLNRLGAERVLECPVPGDGGPDLTDCPEVVSTPTAPMPQFGSYDRQRAKDEQEIGLK